MLVARLIIVLVCALLGAGAPASAAEAPADDDTLRIGEISIRAHQIFDLDDPRENKALYRAANRLHLRTRENVVRAQLLFKTGDPYSTELLEETERNLRQLSFLREPSVRPARIHDGVVDITVDTYDVWTLQIGPSFGRSGGTNHSSFSFEDQNFLGHGKTMILSVDRTVDRDTSTIEWRDPGFAATRWRDDFLWSDTSDGRIRKVEIWRPFYSLATRRTYGLLLADSSLVDPRYSLGSRYDGYRHDKRNAEVYTGWSNGVQDGRTIRRTLGWRLRRDEFQAVPETLRPVPGNRLFNYPYARIEWINDNFETTRDLEQIERTEDQQFGLSGSALLGFAARAAGSDRNAAILELSGNYGANLGERHQVFGVATWFSRIEGGRNTDARFETAVSWYWRQTTRFLGNVKLTLARGSALDLDHYYTLGGDNGLRGYPLRFQQGTGLTLLKFEERYFTGYSLWRLFDIGAAAFVDAGRIHGGNLVGAPSYGWLKDAGVGLRLGNSRSSLGNVIHIDLATPLNRPAGVRGVQWLVSTHATF
jgi:hypothetical protein